MRIIIITIVLIMLAACKEEKETTEGNNLVGNWQLIEVLADPGDGSGTFYPVSSDVVLSFKANGSVLSNGDLCHMKIEPGTSSSGTYSLSDSTITAQDCTLDFYLEANTLIIHYPCIEPCGVKFARK